MPFLTVSKAGQEIIWYFKPVRDKFFNQWISKERYPFDAFVELPKGSIEKLIGRKMRWKDEPFEFKHNYYENDRV